MRVKQKMIREKNKYYYGEIPTEENIKETIITDAEYKEINDIDVKMIEELK